MGKAKFREVWHLRWWLQKKYLFIGIFREILIQ